MLRSAALLATSLILSALGTESAAQITTRASLDSADVQGNGNSSFNDLSGDGEVVVFQSVASNLVASDTNGFSDIFARVIGTGTTERISVDTGGVEGNGSSQWPRTDGGGNRVVFSSNATNLVGTDTNGVSDIFLRDRTAGTTTRVSVDSSGVQSNGSSTFADISFDGRYVVFQSAATNLVAGDTNGAIDIFRHDTTTDETIRISLDDSGIQGNAGCANAAISADGRYVAFASEASNLVTGDTNGQPDIFVRDVDDEITIRVSVDSSSTQANDYSQTPAISGDGERVAFQSLASNLVIGDTNGQGDIFVHDLSTTDTWRVSVDSTGTQANGLSEWPDLASNGEVVAFQSGATNLVDFDTNTDWDVFVHSIVTGETARASVDDAGVEGNIGSYHPSLDAQGLHTSFLSVADNLVVGDTNAVWDIFVRLGLALYFPLNPTSGDPVQFTTYSERDSVGDRSWVLLSCTGTDGFPLGPLSVPLTFDSCTSLSLSMGQVLRARFDANRTANTPVLTFPDVPPGTTFYAAAVTLGPGLQHVTAPITIVAQ